MPFVDRFEYLATVPAEVPPGCVVAHNSVRPTQHLGSRGFRAWLDGPSDRYVACGCGWAPWLAEHYRLAGQAGLDPTAEPT